MRIGISTALTDNNSFNYIAAVGLDPDEVIRNLFGPTDEGAWYDPSDLSTLYQDAKGRTPVTGTGQPVGLMLDKSKGLTLGSELVTNGTFDSNGAGWTVAYGTFDFSGGTADAVGSSAVYQNTSSVISGKTYEIAFDITRYVSGSVSVFFNSNASGGSTGAFTGVGSYSAKIQCVATTTTIYVQIGGVSPDAAVDNISIRELPGNHATQTTSAARPILQQSGATPVLSGTELVSNGTFDTDTSGWTATGGTISLVSGWLHLEATGSPCFASTPVSTVIGKTYRISGQWRSSAGTWRIIAGTNPGSTANYFATPAGSGSVDATFVATATTTHIGFRSVTISEADYGEIDNISVQEVTSWSGGLRYLDFDGVDDYMSVTFAAAQAQPNTLAVAATAAAGDYIYDSAGGDSARQAMYCSTLTNIQLFSGGTANITVDSVDTESVLLVHFDSPSTYLRQNGVVKGSGLTSGVHSWSGITLASRWSGTLYLDGRIYSFVGVNRTLTAGEISDLESWLATKSGVTLSAGGGDGGDGGDGDKGG